MIGIVALLSAAALTAPQTQSQSQVQLATCLKAHLNKEDSGVLVRWVFAGMARGTMVRDLSKVSEEQRVAAMRDAGKVMGRLMTIDCRSEMMVTLKSGGKDEIKSAFSEVGRVAMDTLMADEQVEATFTGIVQYVDMNALIKMMIESGALNGKK